MQELQFYSKQKEQNKSLKVAHKKRKLVPKACKGVDIYILIINDFIPSPNLKLQSNPDYSRN